MWIQLLNQILRPYSGLVVILIIVTVVQHKVAGQGVDLGFMSRSSPAPVFIDPEPARYNIKIGRMNARFRGSLQTEFIDNIALSENNPEADIALNPNLKMGFVYELTAIQLLEFNLGLGYRWYVSHPEANAMSIDPRSTIDYKLTIAGDVEVRFYDTIGIEVDPFSRVDISGQEAGLLEFRRFNNTAGTLVSWQPNSEFRLSGGYSYGMSRSMNDQFNTLDMDTHTLSGAAYYTVSPRLTTGLLASYAIMQYAENTQSDGTSYSAGPIAIYRPTEFITTVTYIGYSVIEQAASSRGPAETLSGFAANITLEHRLNRRITHDLRLSHGRYLGVSGTFNETSVAQYGILARLNSKVSVRGTAMVEALTGEGAGAESAIRTLFYAGTGYQLTRKWSWNAGYSYSKRDSEIRGRGYTQNRITIDFNREF